MDSLKKILELVEQANEDNNKLQEKGTYSRGRSARKALSEIAKLCKEARKEILAKMDEVKSKKD